MLKQFSELRNENVSMTCSVIIFCSVSHDVRLCSLLYFISLTFGKNPFVIFCDCEDEDSITLNLVNGFALKHFGDMALKFF